LSAGASRVVVALMDGRRIKGFVYNFNPNSPLMVFPDAEQTKAYGQQLDLTDCKAVYFVRSLSGDPKYKENKTAFTGTKRRGVPMEVVFKDGERMVGTSEAYNPTRSGFFMFPPDPRSNNLRIFVVNANVQEVRTGTGAGRDRALGAKDRIVRVQRDEATTPGEQGAISAPSSTPPPVAVQPGEDSIAVRDSSRFPGERRVEAVLRVLKGEDPEVVSQEVLVPPGILTNWRDRFLEAGRIELERQGPDPRDMLIAILRSRLATLEDDPERSVS
jgi:transposase-like protein